MNHVISLLIVVIKLFVQCDGLTQNCQDLGYMTARWAPGALVLDSLSYLARARGLFRSFPPYD